MSEEPYTPDGVEAIRANRDYWRALAETRTADLRDLRACIRECLGVTGVWDGVLMDTLRQRLSPDAPAQPTPAEEVAQHLGGVARSLGETTLWSAEQALAIVQGLDSLRRSPTPAPVDGDAVERLQRFVFEDPDVDPADEFVRLADVLALTREVTP